VPATAIVVPVLEASAVADRWRRAYTDDGAAGMPAHVTLLYPFVDDGALMEERVTEVREIAGRFPAFDFGLARFGEFPDEPPVLYLAPEPAEPFAALTRALTAAFPEHPPYGGAFAEVVPHLTLSWDEAAPLEEIRAAVAPTLPIAARAGEAWLMRLEHGRWTAHARAPLAPSS
jgi:2'-5' RNA ligase superfamily